MNRFTNAIVRMSALVLLVGFYVYTPISVSAALPSGFEIQTVVSNLNLPTSIAFTTDGRIFVAEKDGTVKVIKNGALLPTPLIKLSDVNTYGDRGLLGLAVDPNFSANGYAYLLYAYENTPGLNVAGEKTGRVVRITVTGDTSNESTKVVLVGTVGGNISTPSCENYPAGTDCIPSDSLSHSTGGLRFGPDGKLYVTLGDGANFDYADPRSLRAQNIDSLGGKMLRINTDGTAPADNPFYDTNPLSNKSKVFAYGLRNSFKFNFRPGNNALFAGDVGWNTWEEVNLVSAGKNFGWPCREGAGVTPAGLGCTPTGAATDPLYVYGHDANGAGSVTGGTFPTGTAYPASFVNTYFFGDYAQNFIKTINFDANNNVVNVQNFATAADGTDGPVEFATGPEGNVYFLGIYTGTLKKITYTLGNRQPIAVIGANPTSGLTPLSVNFSSTGSSDPDSNPITFLWNFGDSTTSTLANPVHIYAANGSYIATLTVFDGQGGLNIKSINITAGNQAPTVSINSPAPGSFYTPLQSIQLNGSGTDPETGALTSSSLSWRIILHHNIHTHIIETLTGNTPSFIAPDHNDPDVYVEIELTGIDPAGLSRVTSTNIYLNNGSQSGNLVPNPSVETPEPGNASVPNVWLKGGYGINNPVFTYPVAGYDGASAIKVELASYSNGDAKWYFPPVYVNENTVYHFSDYYKSTKPSNVSVQITYADNTNSYIDLGTIPTAAAWTKVDKIFTTPAGAKLVTVFHSISAVGQITTDAFNLSTSAGASDTLAPQVSITNPSANASVSGTISVTANASDNVGVAGVTFIIDGADTGGEKTTALYSLDITTTSLANGNHTISARARDAAGNISTAPIIPFTVANAVPPGSPNKIINGSLETASSNPAKPLAWNNGKYGTNTTVFTYPAPGSSGNGIKIAMTARSSGDAKWFFNDVPVIPGDVYDLSYYYQSDVATTVSLRYTTSTGAITYPVLAATVPSSATFKKLSYHFTIPANVTSLTVMHILNKVGTLTTDEYSLNLFNPNPPAPDMQSPVVSITSPENNATVSGTVTISATVTDNVGVAGVQFLIDDVALGGEVSLSPYTASWDTSALVDGSHTIKVTTHDPAGNTAFATRAVTVSNTLTSQNLIANGSMETANGQNPLGWTRAGWGSNQRTYTYPVVGHDGNKAASFTMSNYVDGDAKWVFTPVVVTPGTIYRYTDYYKSSTISDIIGEYTLTDGSLFYFGLVKEIQPSANWTQVTGTFTPPIGVTKVTFFHLTSENGTFSIDDASLVAIGTTTPATDLVPPVVSITAPANNAMVSGTVNIAADSSDNVGVTYVIFAVDGNIISPQIATAPYSFAWDSNLVPNGTHTIKATTHDAAGNNTATTITVTVSNGQVPPASNLIDNPSFESSDASNNPTGWSKGFWGTNNVSFTYPVTGRTGVKAAQLTISTYTNGDGKWYFAPKAVTPGAAYTFSDYYKSTAPSVLTVRYTLSTNAFVYVDIGTFGPSTDWTQATATLTPPANTTFVTVFHQLRGIGTLSVDDYSLTSN